jgi:cytochrome d ubiquinol oxidase subunit II
VHAIWFVILGAMLTTYAVLDGFDFGAGIVHLFVARTDAERRTVLSAIGPLWDGNEVWLIAAGGALVFAFPRAYGAAFSGLYLALNLVLWLLVLRGISIEFRSKVEHPLWRAAWDTVFAGSSGTMAVVLGVALANVMRGVPLDASGYFHEDLFSGMHADHPGAIDPYTAVFGVFGLATFGAHGATFLAWKTEGELGARCRSAGRSLWWGTMCLLVGELLLTVWVHPRFFDRVCARPWLWPFPLVALGAGVYALRALGAGRDLRAFLASCGFILALLGATAAAMFPVILQSTIDDASSLDVDNASSSRAGQGIGLAVLLPAIALAVGYFVHLFRSFRGKAEATHHY